MAINMGGGIDSLVRDQADTFSMNPQAMQGAQQEMQRATKSGIAPDMIKALALQKVTDETKRAEEEIAASMNQQPGTIVAQRAEALQAKTARDITDQVGATMNQRNRQAAQKMAQLQKQLGAPPAGGIAQQPAPNMARMAGGGIVGYQAGGSAGAGMLGKSEKATAVLNSIGVTPEQYQAMPPEGQQQVLQTIKARRSNMPATPMQQPAPNMARMAGGGIVAFQEGGATDGLAKVRQVQERVDIFRRLGLDPAVVASLSPEGRAAIMDLADRAATASTRDLEQTFPNQISKILRNEANAQQQRADSVLSRSATDASYRDVNLPRAERTALIEDAKKTDANARMLLGVSRDVRGAVPFGMETPTGTYGLFGAGGISPMADDIFPPTSPPAQPAAPLGPSPQMAGIVGTPPAAQTSATAPAAQTPAEIVLGPSGVSGITGAFNPAPIPRPADVGMPKTPLASGVVPAAQKAELAERLKKIDAFDKKLADASGIEAARERVNFVNSPAVFNRQANMDRAQAGIDRRQGILARQAADVAEYNRNNPLRNFAGLGIGSFAQYGVNQQNQMARNRAAELAEEAEINKRELGITAAELKAGEQAAGAGREAFKDVEAGIRQASANQRSVYNTESNMAKAEAENLLNRSVAALNSEDKALRRALDRGDRIYSADTRKQAAQIAAAAKIAKERMASIDNERDREQARILAVAKARESATKLTAELHNELQMSAAYQSASREEKKVMWDRATKAGDDMYQVSRNMIISGARPLLSVEPE